MKFDNESRHGACCKLFLYTRLYLSQSSTALNFSHIKHAILKKLHIKNAFSGSYVTSQNAYLRNYASFAIYYCLGAFIKYNETNSYKRSISWQ